MTQTFILLWMVCITTQTTEQQIPGTFRNRYFWSIKLFKGGGGGGGRRRRKLPNKLWAIANSGYFKIVPLIFFN